MIYRNFIIAVLVVLAYGCSDSNNDDSNFDSNYSDHDDSNTGAEPPVDPEEPLDASDPQWLYVQTAETAQMTSESTLEIPFTRDIFGFTNRPNRQHTYLTAYEFASLWNEEGGNSFYEDPPNAVLTWLDGEQSREVEVIVNNATVYSDGGQEDSLVYDVTLETEQIPDAQMSSVSFFVDTVSAVWGTKSITVLFTDEALDVINETNSVVGLIREMQSDANAVSVVWLAFRPLSSNSISWAASPQRVFAITTSLENGVVIRPTTYTKGQLATSYTYQSDNTFAQEGVAQPGSSIQVLTESPSGDLVVGLAAPVSVNGTQVGGPYGAVPLIPSSSVTLAGTNRIRLFLSSTIESGSILTELDAPTYMLDMNGQSSVTIEYDNDSGSFVQQRL